MIAPCRCALWLSMLLSAISSSYSQVGFNSRYWLHYHSIFMFSMIKIEKLNWQMGEDINCITFWKFVTSLVQKLKILGIQTDCSQYFDSQFLWTPDIFGCFGATMLQNFQRIQKLMYSADCYFKFSIITIKNRKFRKKKTM